MKKNVLLVGGGGAIGRELSRRLGKEHDVFIIDKCKPDTENNSRWFCHDFGNSSNRNEALNQLPSGLSVVFLAGNQNHRWDIEAVQSSINDNISSLPSFLNSFHTKVDHFIFVSTISVYGKPDTFPFDESQPLAPVSIYGATKAAGEMIASSLCHHFSIPITIARTTQLFGIPSANRTLPHYLVNMLSKSKTDVRVTCSPETVRDYLHISDFCDLMIGMIQIGMPEIFNVGSGRSSTIREVFEDAFEAFKVPFCLDDLVCPPLEPASFLSLNISKSINAFGFKPKYSLKRWFESCAQ